MNNAVEVFPLGGVGEFGMNCLCVRCGDEMIVIDAGMGFPEESSYGVDICVPDFEFLEQFRDDITALILTHGHEDHIGAVPYFLRRFNVPVYASNFTIGLMEARLEEHDLLSDVLLHRVEPRQQVALGNFQIEFIRVAHSLIDCLALAITTPQGVLIHTGDYKIDETPIIGQPTDMQTLKRYGDAGVLALLGDSTNTTVQGRTPSEQAVIPAFEEIFRESPSRIFVAAFASSVHRVQIVLDLAAQFGKRVCILGRSMQRNTEVAERLGYLEIPENLLAGINEAKRLARDEIVFLVTGSQGEPRAALAQLASGSYKGLSIEEDDTVVLSARIIPGNEHKISQLEGDIYKRGGEIIDSDRRLVHVSGHAAQEDIRIMTEAVRPQYLVPLHGEYRMLYRHKEYARNHLGFDEQYIKLIENGDVLRFEDGVAYLSERYEVARTFVDETGFEEIAAETIRERKQIAYDGIINVVISLNGKNGNLEAVPEITARGVIRFNGDATNHEVTRELQRLVAESVENASNTERRDAELLSERIRIDVRRYMQKEIGAKPVVVPMIIEAG